MMTQRICSAADLLPPVPVRVRISWAPFAAPLKVEALTLSQVPLTPASTLSGGQAEFLVPPDLLVRAPRLGWKLIAGDGIDEIRVEVCEGAGRWWLLGELLGQEQDPGQGAWMQERPLPFPFVKGWISGASAQLPERWVDNRG